MIRKESEKIPSYQLSHVETIGGWDAFFNPLGEIPRGIELSIPRNIPEDRLVFDKVGGRIALLTGADIGVYALACGDDDVQEEAILFFKLLIDKAAAFNTEDKKGLWGTVVRIGGIGHQETKIPSYEAGMNQLYCSLKDLCRYGAERSVLLTLENPVGGLLLSPLELRDLVNQLNSAYFGIAFNPGHISDREAALDWLNILDRRVMLLVCDDHFKSLSEEVQADLISRYVERALAVILIDTAI